MKITTIIITVLFALTGNCTGILQLMQGAIASQSTGQVIDSNTVFLCLMQGENNSTTFTDISEGGVDSPHTITAIGAAKITTGTNDPFGAATGVFLGATGGARLDIPTSEDFNLGQTFTIEVWLYTDNDANSDNWLGQSQAASPYTGWWFKFLSGNYVAIYDANTMKLTATTGITKQTWNHIALVCNAGSLTWYINGTAAGNTTGFTMPYYSGGDLTINARTENTDTMPCKMSNLRISKIARYTSNFTAPTSPFTQYED